MKIKLKKEILVDELDLPDEAIEDTIVDQSRWSTHHEIIFKYNDKHYKTEYSVGSTESQDEGPWEYEDEVNCTEVEQREVLVKRWVEV